MKFTGQFLSDVEQYRIHQESLRILAEVGVKYHGERSLPLLAKHGAKVDWDKKIAHIPKKLVEETLNDNSQIVSVGSP